MKFTLFLQFFGGRGSSSSSGGGGAGGGAGGGTQPQASASGATPSGVTLDQFNQMTQQQKYDTINNILDDPNIVVPNYLDDSATSKVMYALGMNKPTTVVSDAQLDSMPGREIYRTVYEQGTMPPPSSADVLDQIRNGEYTQLSGFGGSAHGRAIYYATDFHDSAIYGRSERNPMVMRAKINPNANIRSESSLYSQMQNDMEWRSSNLKGKFYGNYSLGPDEMALYAISHNVDGWYSRSYTMMINRGVMTSSSQNKRIGAKDTRSGRVPAVSSWSQAANAK